MLRGHLVAVALAAPLALTACSAGGNDNDTRTERPADFAQVYDYDPTCSKVWVVGKELPASYSGCTDEDSILQAAVFTNCSAGDQYAYTTYQDRLYARAGQPIVETAGDVADLYADCNGEERVTGGN